MSLVSYNPAGGAKDQIDPAGQKTRTTYDAAGRVISVVRNFDSSPIEEVRTSYSPGGQVATLTALNADTGSQITTYTYGVTLANSETASDDMLRKVTYPDAGEVFYEYSRQGQQTKLTDQNGTVHVYGYDKLGRQTSDTADTGSGVDDAVVKLVTSYDNRRRLEKVTSYDDLDDVVNQVQYTYNDFSQVRFEYQEHDGAVDTGASLAVIYSYADGTENTIRRTLIEYPDTLPLAYHYGSGMNDRLSRVEKLSWDATDVATYGYLGLGQVVQLTYPQPANNVVSTLDLAANNTYAAMDRFGRILNTQWKQSSTDLVNLEYGYDLASNRLYRGDEVARGNAAGYDQLYGYDGLNRLTSMEQGTLNSINDTIGSATLTQSWPSLDATGNWKLFTQSVQNPLIQTRTHNQVNEITGIGETVGVDWVTPAY